MARFIALFAVLLAVAPAFAQDELTIAAAADLQGVMPEIASHFEKESGSKIKLSFGSSGNFLAQIQNGAPYDIFFSADVGYPQKLEALGLTDSGSLYQYADGKIVLWVPNSSSVDLSKGIAGVADPAVKKLAIANPAHAPYGRAAESALRKAGLWDSVSPKLVLGENISQTAQFVQSGNADAGILALSLALTPAMKDKGRYYEIPQELYPPIHQAVVILKHSQHQKLARRFLEFLKTPDVVSLLQRYGFSNERGHP
jgi:molybdate transport system substrate-binding protein